MAVALERFERHRRLRALMASARVVSIVGPGGLGKTRLAHVLAGEATQPRVHVVELVGVTAPEDVSGCSRPSASSAGCAWPRPASSPTRAPRSAAGRSPTPSATGRGWSAPTSSPRSTPWPRRTSTSPTSCAPRWPAAIPAPPSRCSGCSAARGRCAASTPGCWRCSTRSPARSPAMAAWRARCGDRRAPELLDEARRLVA